METQTQTQTQITESLPEVPLKKQNSTVILPFDKATVLVLGESQSGKSTFIRKLHELAGINPPDSLRSGDGVKATTAKTTVYRIPFQIERWGLYHEDQEIEVRGAEFSYDKFLELAYDSKLQIKKKSKPVLFELSVIDTPGLKGDDYAEEDNMNEMLKTISAEKQVNSIVFLEGGSNYGPALKSTLQYYQNLIGRGSIFDVIHTKYRADDHLQFLEGEIERGRLKKDGLSEETPADQVPLHARHANFYKDFRGWQHWFIDAKPQKNFAFREWLVHSTISNWIMSLATKNPISVENLPFYKTDKMRRVDDIMMVSNRAKLEGHINGLTEKRTVNGEALRKMYEMQKARNTKEVEIERIKLFLTEWDNDDTVAMGSNFIDSEWKWFKGQESQLSVKQTEFPIMVVTKAINADSACWFDERSESEYGEGKNARDYFIKVRSHMFREVYATCTVFTYKKEVKRIEIDVKKKDLTDLESEVEKLRQEMDAYTGKLEEGENIEKDLYSLINRYTRANQNISQKTMTFDFYDLSVQSYANFAEAMENDDEIEKLNDLYSQKYVCPSLPDN